MIQEYGLGQKNLERFNEILSGRFTAHGLVVDDSSQGLYDSVETFSRDHGMPIEFKQITSSVDPGMPIEAAQNADIVVVDHRLEGKFKGYSDGLAVAAAVRGSDNRQPLFYCSAYGPDFFKQAPNGGRQFMKRAAFLGLDQFAFIFEKDDLVEEKRLREFSQMIYWQALGYTLHRLRDVVPEEVRRIVSAKAMRRKRRLFRILGSAGRGWTSIQEIDNKALTSEELVPTRLLKGSGVARSCSIVEHDVVEFDTGLVLSYFSPGELKGDGISPRVMKILREEDDD